MTMWWVYRPGGAGTKITTASQAPTAECKEGPLDDTISGELQAFLVPNPFNVIPFAVFISRWTDPEYALLMQKRAAAITAGNVALVKQWDEAASTGTVDLNTAAAQNFKAVMISNAILTQARADAIFS